MPSLRVPVVAVTAPCRNCGTPVMPEPLMPDGVIHANGDTLCPGHSTVSSDGSNSAQPGCEAVCAYLAPDGMRWSVRCHFQPGHPGSIHTDGNLTWTT